MRLALVLLAACGGGGGALDAAPPSDGAADAPVDAGPNAPIDAGPDAPADARPDAPPPIDAGSGLAPMMVHIDGAGLGQIHLSQGVFPHETSATCDLSCTWMMNSTASVHVIATAAGTFAGLPPPCAPGSTECDLPAGTTSLSVSFGTLPNEREQATYYSYDIDYDAADRLAMSVGFGVVVLDASGGLVWITTAAAGAVRFAPNGDVFVANSESTTRLDAATGAVVWSHPNNFPPGPPSGARLFPTPSGGAFVSAHGALAAWSASGTETPLIQNFDPPCLGVDASGRMYVGALGSGSLTISVRDATGAVVVPNPFSGIVLPADSDRCEIAVGGTGLAVTTTTMTTVGYARYSFAGAPLGTRTAGSSDPNAPVIAMNAADELVWIYQETDGSMTLERADAANTVLQTVARPRYGVSYGFEAFSTAIAPDGTVAASGWLYGLEDNLGVLMVFDP